MARVVEAIKRSYPGGLSIPEGYTARCIVASISIFADEPMALESTIRDAVRPELIGQIPE